MRTFVIPSADYAEIFRTMFCLSFDEYIKAVGFDEAQEGYKEEKWNKFAKNPMAAICDLDTHRVESLVDYCQTKIADFRAKNKENK